MSIVKSLPLIYYSISDLALSYKASGVLLIVVNAADEFNQKQREALKCVKMFRFVYKYSY